MKLQKGGGNCVTWRFVIVLRKLTWKKGIRNGNKILVGNMYRKRIQSRRKK
jgi:hypothetical protein